MGGAYPNMKREFKMYQPKESFWFNSVLVFSCKYRESKPRQGFPIGGVVDSHYKTCVFGNTNLYCSDQSL